MYILTAAHYCMHTYVTNGTVCRLNLYLVSLLLLLRYCIQSLPCCNNKRSLLYNMHTSTCHTMNFFTKQLLVHQVHSQYQHQIQFNQAQHQRHLVQLRIHQQQGVTVSLVKEHHQELLVYYMVIVVVVVLILVL
jgi:hypothetical protein